MTETSDDTSAPADLFESYQSSLRHISSLPEVPMRRSAVASAIDRLEPDEAVWWLDQLVRGSLWGNSPEIDAMLACADWLLRVGDDGYELMQSLYRAAVDADRSTVVNLLRAPPPHRALDSRARLPEVRLPLPREVSVGERRSLARRSDRDILDRLLLDASPLVITNLLANPSIRVSDVLVVAARRPTLPGLLEIVARSERWFTEHTVREALIQNPYAPTGLALKLLPTLHVQTLRRIRHAGDLHPLVHEMARLLVDLREERTAPWRI